LLCALVHQDGDCCVDVVLHGFMTPSRDVVQKEEKRTRIIPGEHKRRKKHNVSSAIVGVRQSKRARKKENVSTPYPVSMRMILNISTPLNSFVRRQTHTEKHGEERRHYKKRGAKRCDKKCWRRSRKDLTFCDVWVGAHGVHGCVLVRVHSPRA